MPEINSRSAAFWPRWLRARWGRRLILWLTLFGIGLLVFLDLPRTEVFEPALEPAGSGLADG